MGRFVLLLSVLAGMMNWNEGSVATLVRTG